MTADDRDHRRLIDFCTRLPRFAEDAGQAQTDLRWVLTQFQQRRETLSAQLASGSAQDHERPVWRCEIDAIDAAVSALKQLWLRRFGTALTGA